MLKTQCVHPNRRNIPIQGTLLTFVLNTIMTISGLPVEIIHEKGTYLKNLVTTVKLEQFKKDSGVFFDFDPDFPPTQEALAAYKQVADELVEHTKIVRREKFEERKLLIGTTIHSTGALIKSITLGTLCTIASAGTCLLGIKTVDDHRGLFGIIVTTLAGTLSICLGYFTRRCWIRAVNQAEIILQEMKMLNEILDLCKATQIKMATITTSPSIQAAQTAPSPIIAPQQVILSE